MAKPGIPKGTRDFSPVEVYKRQYIFQTIRKNFEKFGYQPIETPSFENSDTLMGKYGEEGDRLIFKILNSGEYFEKIRSAINDLDFSQSFFSEFATKVKKSFDFKSINLDRYNEDKEYVQDIKREIVVNGEIVNLLTDYYLNKKKDEFGYFNNNDLAYTISMDLIGQLLDLVVLSGNLELESLSFIINNIVKKEFYEKIKSNKSTSLISEKALRYDLTVPFARYVVQHQNEIEFPFKRYQIQPVWRADRPQKGRFREFYQCDADVVGSKSLWQEVELVQLYDSVFSELQLQGTTIKINNRKILSGIAEVIGASDKLIDFTVALDKLDKIGEDGVKNEMLSKGISAEALQKVQPLFSFSGTISEKINQLSDLLSNSEEGKKGVEELRFICETVEKLGLKSAILDLDVTLARGLNYYTGAIFEVAAPESVSMGSIGGGGRYDDLTGIFGLKNMSGVGISFGLDRIYLVLEELNLFPEEVSESSKALFFNLGDDEALYVMKAVGKLRDLGISVEMFPDKAKMDKQFKHAEKRNIPFAVIVGSDEVPANNFTVKNLISGEKETVDFQRLSEILQ